jgi:hypothetical protein
MTEAGAAPAPPTLGSVTIVQAPQTIHDQHLPNEAIAVDLTPKELPILDQRSAKLVDGAIGDTSELVKDASTRC